MADLDGTRSVLVPAWIFTTHTPTGGSERLAAVAVADGWLRTPQPTIGSSAGPSTGPSTGNGSGVPVTIGPGTPIPVDVPPGPAQGPPRATTEPGTPGAVPGSKP